MRTDVSSSLAFFPLFHIHQWEGTAEGNRKVILTEPWSESHILVAKKTDAPKNYVSISNGPPHGHQSATRDSTLTTSAWQ